MNSTTLKSVLTTAILTTAFLLVLLSRNFLGFEHERILLVVGIVVMGIAVISCTVVWSRGAADFDDDR